MSKTLPVYLMECYEWSDGEDHGEEQNVYYNTKHVEIMRSESVVYTFMWKQLGEVENGILFEVNTPSGIYEIDTDSKYVEEIDLETIKNLVLKEIESLQKHNWRGDYNNLIKAAQDFLVDK